MQGRGFSFLLLLGLLTGCGSSGSPAGAPPPEDLPPTSVELPGDVDGGRPDTQAIELLFAMNKAVRAMPGASYEAVTFSRGKVGRKPEGVATNADGTWQGTYTARELFRAPAGYRVDVPTDGDPRLAGAKLQIKVAAIELRRPGWGGMFPAFRHIGDPEFLDFRGQRRDMTDFAGITRRLAGSAVARLRGVEQLEDGSVELIEVPRAPEGDPTVVREVLGLDVVSHLPLVIRRYDRKGLVFERKLRGFQPRRVAESELSL